MSRINLKYFTLSWWQLALLLVFVWLLSVLWPIKGLLLPQNWWGQSLIVVINENEARPCGGFATAYGVLELPLFGLETQNSFTLDEDLGSAEKSPLYQVSDRIRFWDLGTTYRLDDCAQSFQMAYQNNTQEKVSRTILVPLSVLEQWAKIFGDNDLFANVSRLAANVDRHDEQSLAERKDPAKDLFRSLVIKTLTQPYRWNQTTQLLGRSLQENQLYWTGVSRWKIPPDSQLLSIAEWNLGGGKSSRYLRKNWSVDLRQISPETWIAEVELRVKNLGGQDEPLSQTWKGGFEFNLFGQKHWFPTEIPVGQSWTYQENFFLAVPPDKVHLYTPPLQNWDTHFGVSVFPQQTLQSSNLDVREHVGTFQGKLNAGGKELSWSIVPDTTPPFLTLHTVVVPDVSEAVASQYLLEDPDKTYFYGEIHFNELVSLTSDFGAVVTDRDFSNPEVSQDPILRSHVLLADQKTLILQFEIGESQPDERFYLTLRGVEDLFGNQIEAVQRTLITR